MRIDHFLDQLVISAAPLESGTGRLLEGFRMPSRAFASFYEQLLSDASLDVPRRFPPPDRAAVAKTLVIDFVVRSSPLQSIVVALGEQRPLERMAPLLSTSLRGLVASNDLVVSYSGYWNFRRWATVYPITFDPEDDLTGFCIDWVELSRGMPVAAVVYGSSVSQDAIRSSLQTFGELGVSPETIIAEAAPEYAETLREGICRTISRPPDPSGTWTVRPDARTCVLVVTR